MAEMKSDGKLVPVEWHISEDVVPRYATNMVVQHSEHEFLLSFFEIWPPMILGPPDEQKDQLEQIDSVRAQCVSRVVLSAGKMPEVIRVLQANYQKYLSAREEK